MQRRFLIPLLLATAVLGFAQDSTTPSTPAKGAPAESASTETKAEAPASSIPIVDAASRELRAGDVLRFTLEEDPVKTKALADIVINDLADAYFPVSRGFEKVVVINVRGKRIDAVREQLIRELEDKYYHKATVELSLYGVAQGATGASGPKVIFWDQIKRTLPLREGEKMMLSEAILRMPEDTSGADLRRVEVARKNASSGKIETLVVNVEAVISKNQVEKDLELKDGDRVRIPERRIRF